MDFAVKPVRRKRGWKENTLQLTLRFTPLCDTSIFFLDLSPLPIVSMVTPDTIILTDEERL